MLSSFSPFLIQITFISSHLKHLILLTTFLPTSTFLASPSYLLFLLLTFFTCPLIFTPFPVHCSLFSSFSFNLFLSIVILSVSAFFSSLSSFFPYFSPSLTQHITLLFSSHPSPSLLSSFFSPLSLFSPFLPLLPFSLF